MSGFRFMRGTVTFSPRKPDAKDDRVVALPRGSPFAQAYNKKKGEYLMARPILNISDVELQSRPAAFAATGSAAERFDARMGFIAPLIGAKQLGYNLTAVPPGKRAFP